MPTPQTIRAMQQAVAHHQAGRFLEAGQIYRSVLARDPRDADALHLLGLLHHQSGRNEQAIEMISRAIAIRPEPVFYVNLSNAQKALGRIDDAISSCRRAVEKAPQLAEAWNNMGTLYEQKGDTTEALAALNRAIQLSPRYAAAYSNLGNTLARLGRTADAVAAMRRAIELDPKYAPAYINLAHLLSQGDQLDEAIALSRRAIQLGTHLGAAYVNLGVALHLQGRFEEGNRAFEQGLAIEPNHPRPAENLLSGMCYTTRYSPQQVLQKHVDWAKRFADPLMPVPPIFSNDRSTDRKLRIGYISPDLRRHSVAYFLEPILEHHDRAKFEITAYSNTETPDQVTQRLRSHCDRWRDIVTMTDEQAAAQIRADHIDVLVDLAGHTVSNSLLVLARKPAPVQMTYLGYPGTTGMRAIDYRITDALADPVGESEAHYTEKLLRVSPPFVRYRPPAEAPAVVDPPVRRNGFVTFGSFNKGAKIGTETISLWSKVLHANPTARLLIKSIGIASEGSRTRILDGFNANGINAGRITIIEAKHSLADHLAMYGQIDVALDTFPYHGTTTTCEALWMGVPVVTLIGSTHVSRVGLSLLSSIDRQAWCAANKTEFTEIATNLSGNAKELSRHRASLRGDVSASKICDYRQLTREIEQSYRECFSAWSADQKSF